MSLHVTWEPFHGTSDEMDIELSCEAKPVQRKCQGQQVDSLLKGTTLDQRGEEKPR